MRTIIREISKKIHTVTSLLAFSMVLSFSPAWADDPRAREIMEKVDARYNGNNQVSDVEMVLIDKQGKIRVRKIKSFKKDKGDDSYQIMFFLEPSDVKGTGFLTHDYDDPDKEDDQWIYLPALHKTRRITSRDKNTSFMGSDFNYSDMTSKNNEDYDYTLLKEQEVNGKKTWIIEALPRRKKVIEESGYKKLVLFVRQDNYVIIRSVQWVKKGNDIKYMEVKKLERINNIWVATETHMTTKRSKQTLHKTILKLHAVKFNQKISESLFTVRQLKKGF